MAPNILAIFGAFGVSSSPTDESDVIYSPSLSDSLNTEPSSVSDLTLDLSDYCLPTLYGSPTSLVTPDARPRLSPAGSLAPKTPRFILSTVFSANIRGGFCQKTDELMNPALSCIKLSRPGMYY